MVRSKGNTLAKNKYIESIIELNDHKNQLQCLNFTKVDQDKAY